jgi:hypothetical protein
LRPQERNNVGDLECVARTNNEKSHALAKAFFPARPRDDESQPEPCYLRPCKMGPKVTAEQVRDQLGKLKPYKAPGPDGIPNIILTKCVDILTERLLYIYSSILELGLSHKPWKSS